MKPYYTDGKCTIYHGDCREILLELGAFDSIITDPVWPNAVLELEGSRDPEGLFKDAARHFKCNRLAVQLGCDSDPRFLQSLPRSLPFFRTCWLEYACPSYKGRLLHTGDVAYLFGAPPRAREGRMVIPGKCISSASDWKLPRADPNKESTRVNGDLKHPCPRRLQHVEWLVKWWANGLICDPFCGIGTTLVAAQNLHYDCIGIELEEKYCEIAARRLQQECFEFGEVPA